MAYYTKQVQLKDLFQNILTDIKTTGIWTVKDFGKDLTPHHTTYSQNDFEVIQSGNYSSYYGHHAFNHTQGNFWQQSISSEAWLGYDFGKVNVDNKVLVTEYAIQMQTGNTSNIVPEAPKKWVFEGSQDNTTWVPLDVREDEIDWYYYEKRYFQFDNVIPYRYYRIRVQESNTTSYVRIGSLELSNSNDLLKREAILTSTGTGGDKVHVYLSAFYSVEPNANQLEIGYIEDFNHTTLKSTNAYKERYCTASTNSLTANNNQVIVTYHLEVNKDRIFLVTVLDPSASYTAVNACYVGLMKRYSPEGNNHGTVLLQAIQSRSNNPTVLKNKMGVSNSDIWTKWINATASPSVWGDNVFLSPIFLEGQYEGIRGELIETYAANESNLVNEDEVLINSTRHKVFLLTSYGTNSFPNNCIVMKLPNE